MKGLFSHPLLWSALAIGALYGLFAHLISPPLPRSLLVQYMVICVIGVLLVATFNDASAERMAAPFRALLGAPHLKAARVIAFVLIVGGVGGLTYLFIRPSLEAPVELRTVHPAPPSTIRVYGKSYNLLKLENPLRKKAKKGSEEFKAYVRQGGDLYYKNCHFCHGDVLAGKGHFALGFNPRPANFQDVGTIAQLQESYLFWRITTGGPGLPREGAPWASAMPVWHEMMKEEDVWKVILFLYDYTGHEPRSWELEAKKDGPAAAKTPAKPEASAKISEEEVQKVYAKRCQHCHGEDGDGEGPVAGLMYPKPRDFSLGVFKYKSTHADDEFPTDADLKRTILKGLPGTAMPGWQGVLSDREIDGLIQMIKVFGGWEEEEVEHKPIDKGTPVPSSPASIAKGRALFVKACVQCHGEKGRGDITSGKKLQDDWENRIWPRNLTRPDTWRWSFTAQDVFERISTGIRSTPMPEHTTTMPAADRWHVANYVMSLRKQAPQMARGETVVRATRHAGPLPGKPGDKAWEKAKPIMFPMVPNVIKEPRLYFALNDAVTVRALYNDSEIVIRLDIDDRTYSVPGHDLEKRYRIEDVAPSSDAAAIQFPVKVLKTSEKPWFRHGDPKHGVNMWYWRAPSQEPRLDAVTAVLDAAGPNKPPRPRKDDTSLKSNAEWKDGRWSIVFRRSLKTQSASDIQLVEGQYVPIAFANWDGVTGEKGGRHSFTTWYWLLLVPEENPVFLAAASSGAGLLAGILFLLASWRQRRGWGCEEEQHKVSGVA